MVLLVSGAQPALDESDPRHDVLLVGGAGSLSGVPNHITQICNTLKEHARITVASDANEGGFDKLRDLGVQHHVIHGLSARCGLARTLGAGWALLKLLRCSQSDLIWLHAPFPVLLARIALLFRLWCPLHPVLCSHHTTPYAVGHGSLKRLTFLMLERLILQYAPAHDLIYLTTGMRDQAISLFGLDAMDRHRVQILANSSDLGALPIIAKRADPHLIMTTRNDRQKDLELAIRVIGALPENYTLALCGEGTNTAGFKKQIAAYDETLLDRITLVGPVKDVRPYLAEADSYLMTSRYEGLPIGALEAFEAGLPIVLRQFEGANELVRMHPLGACLAFSDLADDSSKIVKIVEQYRTQKEVFRPAIRPVWEANWSPAIFEAQVQKVFHSTLGIARLVSSPDPLRDGPTPLRHHQNSVASRSPEQQQQHISDAPSPSNG